MRRRRIDFGATELAFVEARQSLERREIHAAFVAQFGRHDVSVQNIKALCVRRGWCSREAWNDADDAIIRAEYPDTPTATLATKLNRSMASVYNRAKTLGVAKSAAFLAGPNGGRLRTGSTAGVAHRFVKGQVSHNKGVKYPKGWAPGRMRESQFTRGQRSQNHMPLGSERIVGGYRYTKIRDELNVKWTTNWRATHLVRWEEMHGPIPTGHVLKCKDGNPHNVEPTNWTPISRSILPRLNGAVGRRLAYDDAPTELKETILVVAQLEHAAKSRQRSGRAS